MIVRIQREAENEERRDREAAYREEWERREGMIGEASSVGGTQVGYRVRARILSPGITY